MESGEQLAICTTLSVSESCSCRFPSMCPYSPENDLQSEQELLLQGRGCRDVAKEMFRILDFPI